MKINSLLAGTLALVLVTGMTGSAFAGQPFDCTITQGDMLSVQLPAGEEVTIPKEVQCNEDPVGVAISFGDCVAVGVEINFENDQFDPLVFTLDEIFTNLSLGNDEAHCLQAWEVTSVTGVTVQLEQELWFNEPIVVGGELLPIDSTALVLAGLQTSAIWMLPVLAGVAGSAFGILYIKSRRN